MTNYKPREISRALQKALDNMPVVVLTGMRQVGKSTLLQEDPGWRKRRYFSLDDFAVLEAARRNPESLLTGEEAVTIDEAQKCPELLTAVKKAVDRKRTPGRFLLSGSANFALLRGVSETLAGRAVYLDLQPFTRREIHGELGTEPFLTRFFRTFKIPDGLGSTGAVNMREILTGGLPPVCLGTVKDPEIWFKGYEQTYLERDLRELSQVGDLVAFRRFFRLAALRTARILKISELSRDARLNSATGSRYLNLLETSFVVRRLEPFLGNRSSRLIKSPKIYLADSGLAGFLAGVEDLNQAAGEPMTGALLETYVFQNLLGILESRWLNARIYFWHVQGRREIDFIIESGRETVAVEVKAGTRFGEQDLSGLQAFLAATPNCRAGILAYNGTQAVRLDKKTWAIPLSMLLS